MCLIVMRPKNLVIPFDKFETAITNNPDGYGLTYPAGDGKRMLALRSAEKPDPDKLYRLIQDELKDVDIMLHLRYNTAGDTVLRNAHPFPVLTHKSDGIDLRMAHNGTIYKYKTKADKGESDTRCFVRSFVRPLLERINRGMYSEDYLQDEFIMGLIAEEIPTSSVLTFLDAEGNSAIINPQGNGGFNDGGIYYSNKYSFNKSHREPTTVVTSYPSSYKTNAQRHVPVDPQKDVEDYSGFISVIDKEPTYKVGDRVETSNGHVGTVESSSYGWVEISLDDGSEIYCMEYTLKHAPKDDKTEEENAREEVFYTICGLSAEELICMTEEEIDNFVADPEAAAWLIEHMQDTIREMSLALSTKELEAA